MATEHVVEGSKLRVGSEKTWRGSSIKKGGRESLNGMGHKQATILRQGERESKDVEGVKRYRDGPAMGER